MSPLLGIMQTVAAGGNLPLYQQLEIALRQAIEQHLFGPNRALPAERQLATELGISRITVRKAIDGLVADGILARTPGSGTYINVHPRVEKNFAKLTSFSEDIRARGQVPSSRWLKRQEGSVTPEEALRFRLSPGAPVYRFNRIRCADGIPMCIEYATLVKSALGSIDDVDASMYEALGKTGHRPVRALQRLSAIVLNQEQAELLESRAGAAGLCVERLGFLADGRAVEFCRSFFRGDMYDFVAELNAL